MTLVNRTSTISSIWLRRGLLCLLLLATVTAVLGSTPPHHASAEAEPVRTTPADGELLTRWPRAIAVSFSEQIDQDTSTLRLVDASGADIPGTSLTFGPDGATMSIVPPTGLPNGTYNMIWEAHSAVDDAITPGYASFTVGTAADGSVITVPSTGSPAGGPPQWLETVSRGIALLGMVALVAIWPAWSLIVRPAVSPIWRRAEKLVHQVNLFTICAVTLALLGSIFEMVVIAQNQMGGSGIDKIMNTIGQTRWGYAWIARIVLIILLAILLALNAWWFIRRRPIERIATWVVTLALPLTFALASHAWDEPVGRAATVAANYTHTLAAAIWAGSVLVLLAVLMPSLRGIGTDVRHQVLISALSRFGGMTLVTWIVIALTGIYAAWLQIGNINALTSTSYGRATTAKLVAVAISLLIVAFILVVVRGRIRRGDSAWSKRLTIVLGLQAALVAAIVMATGQMSSLPPARDVVIEEANQVSIPIPFAGRPSTLLIAPGSTGINHLRLEVPGGYLPNETEARVHISLPGRDDLGEKDILLSRVSGNNFEHHGSEFSIDGEWQLTVSLLEPGFPVMTQNITHTFGDEAPAHNLPGIPWRFNPLGGVSAVLLLLIGIGGVFVAAYAGKTPLRKEAGGLGAIALALGVVVLLQARYDPIIAIGGAQGTIDENDLLMVERGELVYTDACLSCHGADLRGDGPLANTMDPPPADFSAPHTYVHPDEDLVYWVKNGKQGTGMPAFDNTLTDQEIRDVLAYIKNRQQDMGEEATVVQAEACIVGEMSFADLTGSFNHSIHPDTLRGTPLVSAADPSVDGDTQNDILFTIEQLVACTNSGNALQRLPLFTKEQIMDMFPMGLDARLTALTTTGAQPLPEDAQVGLDDVQSIRQLADGRIAADVVFTDPAGVGISLDDENPLITHATLVFIWDDDAGAWLIDEIR